MEYRLDKKELIDHLRTWNRFFKRKVHLIACGGTAMTLLGVKASTKDVDFTVPEIRELMRGTQVDVHDCVMLAKAHKDELDLEKLIVHYNDMVG